MTDEQFLEAMRTHANRIERTGAVDSSSWSLVFTGLEDLETTTLVTALLAVIASTDEQNRTVAIALIEHQCDKEELYVARVNWLLNYAAQMGLYERTPLATGGVESDWEPGYYPDSVDEARQVAKAHIQARETSKYVDGLVRAAVLIDMNGEQERAWILEAITSQSGSAQDEPERKFWGLARKCFAG